MRLSPEEFNFASCRDYLRPVQAPETEYGFAIWLVNVRFSLHEN
jgi:hypothetical protein